VKDQYIPVRTIPRVAEESNDIQSPMYNRVEMEPYDRRRLSHELDHDRAS
jgi:hypothetical protein